MCSSGTSAYNFPSLGEFGLILSLDLPMKQNINEYFLIYINFFHLYFYISHLFSIGSQAVNV